jgi:hypothetical protein
MAPRAPGINTVRDRILKPVEAPPLARFPGPPDAKVSIEYSFILWVSSQRMTESNHVVAQQPRDPLRKNRNM